jgi:GT2 family glycosyltransferase
MRFSILIASHNDGDALRRTIESCIRTCNTADYEIVVVDDASTDNSAFEVKYRFPFVRMVQNSERRGHAAAKRQAAEQSRGRVLVFLDARSNPEHDSISQIVRDVENVDGRGIVTPQLQALDDETWKNVPAQAGHGYRLSLKDFGADWIPFRSLKPATTRDEKLYVSPALHGACFAVSRMLYEELQGFDPYLGICGFDDLDFGLRCWMMGSTILHNPCAIVGYRFSDFVDRETVELIDVVSSQLRMAHKCFVPSVAAQWVCLCRQRHQNAPTEHPEGVWARAWTEFLAGRSSAEADRRYLQANRQRDEFAYAREFGLKWPALAPSEYDGTGAYGPDVYAMYPCETYPAEMYPQDVYSRAMSRHDMYAMELCHPQQVPKDMYAVDMFPPES